MSRVVINRDFGGFGLSDAAMARLRELTALRREDDEDDVPRDDPRLLQVIDEMGAKAASGRYADLGVVEVPDDVAWHIEDYDGSEWVAEDHRTWGQGGPE